MSVLTQATLCVIVNEETKEILLGMKKAELFGGGKFNGPGGKFKETDKIIENTAIRETQEEAGLTIRLEDLTKAGEFTFIFPESQSKYNQVVHVYYIARWQGNPTNSDEMTWRWFSFDKIPYERMWADDEIWLPQILQGKRLKGVFYFNEQKQVKNYELNEAIF